MGVAGARKSYVEGSGNPFLYFTHFADPTYGFFLFFDGVVEYFVSGDITLFHGDSFDSPSLIFIDRSFH